MVPGAALAYKLLSLTDTLSAVLDSGMTAQKSSVISPPGEDVFSAPRHEIDEGLFADSTQRQRGRPLVQTLSSLRNITHTCLGQWCTFGEASATQLRLPSLLNLVVCHFHSEISLIRSCLLHRPYDTELWG
jgi:hypothetical protein